MKKLRNVVVACDYAYVEGGAAGMAVLTAALLSKQTDYNVWFLGGCGEAAQELKGSGVKCVLLGLPDLLQNPSKADAFLLQTAESAVLIDTGEKDDGKAILKRTLENKLILADTRERRYYNKLKNVDWCTPIHSFLFCW